MNDQPASAQRPPGVLVADDEGPVCTLLATFLRHKGFRVWTASDGQEAINTYRANRSSIDVVLLDVRMPTLDGPEALAALRQVNPNVRCCFMTGATGRYTPADLIAVGSLDVLLKPFTSLESVVARLREILLED